MRIAHTLAWYFPESTGGTEIYVRSLVQALRARGVDNVIMAGDEQGRVREYELDGTRVVRYPVPESTTKAQARGFEAHGAFERFSDLLKRERCSIYHQHSWVYGCNIHHLRAARALGMRTVTTVHLPAVICLRRTMMEHGSRACDGLVGQVRCARCWSESRQIPPLVRAFSARLPRALSSACAGLELGRLESVLATVDIVDRWRKQLAETAALSDRLIAVSEWLYAALEKNGVPRHKLSLCRQGVPCDIRPGAAQGSRNSRLPRERTNIGFLGRWDADKGIHIIVEAVKKLPPGIPVTLHICAGDARERDRPYKAQVLERIGNDPRIRILPAIPRSGVQQVLESFDWLAVPSQCLETGPLVVLEALALGVPVIGSDLGGIRELVTHEVNGLLVSAADVETWSNAVRRAATDDKLLAGLSLDSGRVRSASDVARDMMDVYGELE